MKTAFTSLSAALFLILLGATPLPVRGAITDGLELLYQFDGDTATAGGILDSSGNLRNGSVVNYLGAPATGVSFSSDVPAFLGSGLSLDLSSTVNFVSSDSPGYTGVLGTSARTIAAWVKVMDNSVQNPTIAEWGAGANGQRYTFKINTTSANGVLGGLRVEVAGGYIISGSRVIDDGGWHHVAATFVDDGTPDVEDVLLYIDGVLDNVAPPPTTPNAEPINTVANKNVTFGGSVIFTTASGGSVEGRPLAGLIDEVGIWSRALSPAEIATLVPEPGSLALVSLGAALLFGLRRRAR